MSSSEMIAAASQGFARDAAKMQALSDALRIIVFARDFNAEYGRYPYADEIAEPMAADQCFDDWAADVAQRALDHCSIPLLKVADSVAGDYYRLASRIVAAIGTEADIVPLLAQAEKITGKKYRLGKARTAATDLRVLADARDAKA